MAAAISGCQNLTLPATAPFSVQCQQTYATNSSHSIVATYAGDTNYTGSANAAYPESVSQVNTSTAIGASTDSTTYGQSVTFTATVTAATGTPTGSVTFFDNGTNIGTSALSTTAGVTTANLPLATLPAGPDTVTAQYGGTTEFAGSSTPPAGVVVNVAKAATTTATVTSNLNPSVSGQSVTFTAAITVNAPGAGTPTGTVTFYDNGTAIGTGTVGTSVPPGPAIGASLTISSLSVATHPITASYGGDTNFVGSTTGSALQQVVNGSQVGTTTVIENAPSVTTTVSQVPTLVAGVTGGSAPFPSGTVTFKQGTTVLGTAPLVEQSAADVAQLPVPQFSSTYAIGTHTITAVYSGDGTHIGSTSAPVTLTVVSPIFEDIDLGEEFVVLNSQTGAVANSFFDGSNSCGCNGQDYLAISPDGTRAYMLDPGSSTSTVHVINTATGAVLASISVSGWAGDIVTSPDGTHVYVGTYSSSSNTLDVISTATNTVTSSIAVTGGGILTAMAINPAGTEMFVTLQTAVAVVNLSTQRTVADIALSGAEGIAVNPNGSAAYATNGFHGGAAHSNTVSVISTSTNTVTRTFTGFTEPTNLTVNPAGTELYVSSVAGGNGFVTGVNLSSGTETNLTLPSSDSGQDLAVSPNGATLYLSFNSLTNNDGVFEINTSNLQIATTLSPLGGFATDDTIRPFGGAPTPPTLTPMSITTTSLPGAAKGQYYSTTLAATGGLSPYSWQLTGGTLPAGLTLSPAGTVYGTPTTAGGPVSLTFTASDSNFPTDTATATLPLTIASGSTAPPPCGGSEAGFSTGPARAERLCQRVEHQPERVRHGHEHRHLRVHRGDGDGDRRRHGRPVRHGAVERGPVPGIGQRLRRLPVADQHVHHGLHPGLRPRRSDQPLVVQPGRRRRDRRLGDGLAGRLHAASGVRRGVPHHHAERHEQPAAGGPRRHELLRGAAVRNRRGHGGRQLPLHHLRFGARWCHHHQPGGADDDGDGNGAGARQLRRPGQRDRQPDVHPRSMPRDRLGQRPRRRGELHHAGLRQPRDADHLECQRAGPGDPGRPSTPVPDPMVGDRDGALIGELTGCASHAFDGGLLAPRTQLGGSRRVMGQSAVYPSMRARMRSMISSAPAPMESRRVSRK